MQESKTVVRSVYDAVQGALGALADPEVLDRLCFYLVIFAFVLIASDAGVVFAGNAKVKLKDIGENAFYSFSEYAQYGGAALFSTGAIPALAGRDMGGLGMGLMTCGVGVACVRYVPDFLTLIKAHGGLL
jgi:hypothetical protein